MDDLLQQGITAYKAGKRDEARNIFIAVVKQTPDNERAWGWMYQVSNNDEERIHCMKQALRINPANEKAKQILDSLMGQDSPFEMLQNVAPPVKKETNIPSPETIYYQDGNITVTNTRAILETKTYAMANITSVSMGEMPANRTPGIFMVLIGLGFFAYALLILITGIMGNFGDFFGGFVGGVIFTGIGLLIAKSEKALYIVKIGSASGESNALTSKDRELIQKIVDSINQAIIKRG